MSDGTWIDGCYTVERPQTSHLYIATDAQGNEHRWLLASNGIGGFTFTRLRAAQPESHVLWGIMAVRGWLLDNGYTPRGSRSEEWQKEITERQERHNRRAA